MTKSELVQIEAELKPLSNRVLTSWHNALEILKDNNDPKFNEMELFLVKREMILRNDQHTTP